MSPALLSIRMKSFPAPFIFAKRSMMLIVAAAVLVVMSGLGRDISSCLLKLEIPRLRSDRKNLFRRIKRSARRLPVRSLAFTYSAVKRRAAWIFLAILGLTPCASFAGDYNNVILEQTKK